MFVTPVMTFDPAVITPTMLTQILPGPVFGKTMAGLLIEDTVRLLIDTDAEPDSCAFVGLPTV